MKIKMKLLSDTIFGNGNSVPGGEDISVLHDPQGFPYYKGSTFKGIFREEMKCYLQWAKGKDEKAAEAEVNSLLGAGGEDRQDTQKLIFSDFVIPDAVKQAVLYEAGDSPEEVLEIFTNLRTFTAIEEDGMVKEGSLRIARCINSGIVFESSIFCDEEKEAQIKEILGLIKWIGTMRNRGFGKVLVEAKGVN